MIRVVERAAWWAIILTLSFASMEIFMTAASYEPLQEVAHRGWRPPDLSKCPKDVALWDCIHNTMWRKDL